MIRDFTCSAVSMRVETYEEDGITIEKNYMKFRTSDRYRVIIKIFLTKANGEKVVLEQKRKLYNIDIQMNKGVYNGYMG